MIRHVVLFKFNDDVSWQDPRAVAAEQITLGHPSQIPEILRWQVGRNVAERSDGYHFAVIGDFADQDALDRYMRHPDHQRGVTSWRAISSWVVVDLLMEDGAHQEAEAVPGVLQG